MQIFRHRIDVNDQRASFFVLCFRYEKPASPDFNYKHERLITLQIVKRSFVVLVAEDKKMLPRRVSKVRALCLFF